MNMYLHTKMLNNMIVPLICMVIILCSQINIQAFAQQNSTNTQAISSNTTSLPKSGVQLLLYTKSGGLAGLDQIYSYNIVTKELTFVDLKDKKNITASTKILTEPEIANLTDTFYLTYIFRDRNVYDLNKCPDCIQYGLSYSFIDTEKLVPFDGKGFWTEKTTGAEHFATLAKVIENFAAK
jgi:hypothetical protein